MVVLLIQESKAWLLMEVLFDTTKYGMIINGGFIDTRK